MGASGLRSSVVLSILLHGAIALAWLFTSYFAGEIFEDKRPAKKDMVWIELEKPKNQSKDESQKIVSTQLVQPTDIPAPDAYLGKQNQVVREQTSNREREKRWGSAKQQARRKGGRENAQTAPLAKLALPILPRSGEHGLGDADRPEWTAESTGVPKEYIRGLKSSEQTFLNTREMLFYGYHQRVGEQLDQAWTQYLKDFIFKLYRSGRRLASNYDYVTRVTVTLSSGGQVVRVKLVEDSGSRDLDDTAIRAFNKAGPFPNPPKGMVNAKGEIEIPWKFVLHG